MKVENVSSQKHKSNRHIGGVKVWKRRIKTKQDVEESIAKFSGILQLLATSLRAVVAKSRD